jgi:hypothetical protein
MRTVFVDTHYYPYEVLTHDHHFAQEGFVVLL